VRLQRIAKLMGGQRLTEEKLEEIHDILLVIFDDLTAICEKNGLKYAMIGGSAIGALRHKGFIPWDDDIDIIMPRKDFERLYQVILNDYSDKYSILHPQDKKNYGRVLPKIRLQGTEYRKALEKDLDDCGISIDIFPVENTYNNFILRYCQGIMAMGFGFALSCRRIFKRRKEFIKFTNDLSFKCRCVIGFLLSFASLEKWAQWTDYWYSKCENDNSIWVTVPSDGKHFFGGLQRRSEFCTFHKVEFEGRESYVPGNYDIYLRGYYGDYMKIPPKEKQELGVYLTYNPGKYEKRRVQHD
jgi:lipopolysaccharide cholinephosphotransferase